MAKFIEIDPHLLSPAEADRLDAVRRLNLIDAPVDAFLDRITSLIRTTLSVDVGFVSAIDAHRLIFKAMDGMPGEGSEVRRQDTLCETVIRSKLPVIVNDASMDSRFASNPFVAAENGVKFYAGFPLLSSDGNVLGTVSAVSFQPRIWSKHETQIMTDLAAVTMENIELASKANYDSLTGVLARRAFLEDASVKLRSAALSKTPFSVINLDIDCFKNINDTHGHAVGDQILRAVVQRIQSKLRQGDVLGRIGGEEFVIALPQAWAADASIIAERVRSALASTPFETSAGDLEVTASIGVASRVGKDGLDSLLAQADHAMYISKAHGRNRVSIAESSSSRRAVMMVGRMSFGEGRPLIDCTVRSLGPFGAGLDVIGGSDIPQSFDLFIGNEEKAVRANVVAQSHRRIEVAFSV